MIDYVANRSHIGKVFTNPLWYSVVITLTIIIIALAFTEATIGFKFVFYLFALILGATLAHDTFIEQQYVEQNVAHSAMDIASDIIENSSEVDSSVTPRAPEERPSEYYVPLAPQEMTIDELDRVV